MAWLKLMRWKNLAIIFLTQFLAWFCVIRPHNPVVLTTGCFLLLSLSTLLIAAAGYIINDYFDIRIDAINRPEKMVVGHSVSPRLAIIVHSVLNFVAIVMAGFVAWHAGHPLWVLTQCGCTILLWLYSTRFKREFMTGNVVVSLLTALTILTLVLYEPAFHQLALAPLFSASGRNSALPFMLLMAYSWFAFMLNWIREIVKDMEDFNGDAREGCETLPIVKGLNYSIGFVLLLVVFVLVPLLLGCVALLQHHHLVFALYVGLLLILPLVAWAAFFRSETSTPHFTASSRYLKVIMVLGIISLIIYYLQL